MTNPIPPSPHRALALAAVIGAALFPNTALAVEEYPPIVQKVVGTPCEPGCQLCHTVAAPTASPAISSTDFFTALTATDTWQFEEENIASGLSEMTMADRVEQLANDTMFDTDGNGVNDIEELRAGVDPFLPNEPDLCASGATYGCGAHIAPQPDFSVTSLGFALLGLAGLIGRRRRSTCR